MVQSRDILLAVLAGASPTALLAQAAAPAARPAAAVATRPVQAAADEGEDEGVITVVGQRERGAVEGDIKPEQQLSPADIRSFGVSSISDLLTELSPQTTSGRGRGGEMPVVLLNGKRISGFREIQDIPTEAIQRVDILPEEVALKYGYSANQKVINFVLRPRFRAITGELTGGLATEGDYGTQRVELDTLRIRDDGRFSLGLDYKQNDGITEADRGVTARAAGRPYDYLGNVTAATGTTAEIDPALSALAGQTVTVAGVPASAAGGRPALGSFAANTANVSAIGNTRSLTPSAKNLTVNMVYAHPITDKISGTINAGFGATGSESLRGPGQVALLIPAGDPFSPFTRDVTLYRYLANLAPLYQSSSGVTGHLGGTANGELGKWRWNLTGNYDYAYTNTISLSGLDATAAQALLTARSATFNPFAAIDPALIGTRTDRANSTANTGNVQLVTGGPIFHLPGGDVRTNVKIGQTYESLDAFSLRSGLAQTSKLSRGDTNGQVNLDIPVTSVRDNFLSAIGSLSLNANAAVDRYSDFGALWTYGYGFRYTPVERYDLIGSFTRERGAPTLAQLGAPQVTTSNVPFYDPVTGTTAVVTQVSGGNPALTADSRRVYKLGLTAKPFAKTDLTFTANYTWSKITNPIASLPTAITAAVAAFPDRFTRDATGQLTRIDTRSVNFVSESTSQLRWGFNFSMPLKSNTARLIAAYRAAYPNGRPGFPGFGGRGPGQGPGQTGQTQQGQPGAPGQPAPGQQANAEPVPGQPGQPPVPGQSGEGPPPGAGGFGGPPGGGGFGGPGGGGRGGPGGRFGGGGQNGGRLQFALYHTWFFRDQVVIRPGIPTIDLLNGGATGSSGGQPRHELELQAGYSNNGLGVRLSGDYQTPTRVLSGLSTSAATGDLRFSSLTTFNLRLFANLQQIPAMVRHPWARGMRVSVNLTNLFNQRQDVRDATGATPLIYQAGYLNPIGRTVSLSVRKLFF